MTRKDYIILARAIATVWREEVSDEYTLGMIISELSYELERDNPRFDAEKFRKACRGE